MNRALILGLYRRCLRSAAALHTPEMEVLAKGRYVEFLPRLFTLPSSSEAIPSIIRRAFRFPPPAANIEPISSRDSDLNTMQAVTRAFNFIRHVEQEKEELEAVSQWMKHDPKRCSEIIGASIIAHSYACQLVPRGGSEPRQDTLSTPPGQQVSSLDKTIQDVTVQVDAIALLVRALLLKNVPSQPQPPISHQPLKRKKVSKTLPPPKSRKGSSKDDLVLSMDTRVVVQTIIDVLLREMKFTALHVSPVEGFLIDKVLSTRLASGSVLSLLFSAIGKQLGLKCSVTLDQRCPMVKVACQAATSANADAKKKSAKQKVDNCTDDDKALFVNLVDGGTILSPSAALKYQVKHLNNNEQARLSLKAADLRVVYCGILASILVATNGQDDAKLRTLLKAQLIHLAKS